MTITKQKLSPFFHYSKKLQPHGVNQKKLAKSNNSAHTRTTTTAKIPLPYSLQTEAVKNLQVGSNIFENCIFSGILSKETIQSKQTLQSKQFFNSYNFEEWNRVPNDIIYCLLDYANISLPAFLDLRLVCREWNYKIMGSLNYKQFKIMAQCKPKSILSFRYGLGGETFFEVVSKMFPTHLKQCEKDQTFDTKTLFDRSKCGYMKFSTGSVALWGTNIYGVGMFEQANGNIYFMDFANPIQPIIMNHLFTTLNVDKTTMDAIVVEHDPSQVENPIEINIGNKEGSDLLTILKDKQFVSQFVNMLIQSFREKKFVDARSLPLWCRNIDSFIQYVCYYGNTLLCDSKVVELVVLLMKICSWNGSLGSFLIENYNTEDCGDKQMKLYSEFTYGLSVSPLHVVVKKNMSGTEIYTYVPLQVGHPYFSTLIKWRTHLLVKYHAVFQKLHSSIFEHDLSILYNNITPNSRNTRFSRLSFEPANVNGNVYIPALTQKILDTIYEINIVSCRPEINYMDIATKEIARKIIEKNYSLIENCKQWLNTNNSDFSLLYTGNKTNTNSLNTGSENFNLSKVMIDLPLTVLKYNNDFSCFLSHVSNSEKPCRHFYPLLKNMSQSQFDSLLYYDAEFYPYARMLGLNPSNNQLFKLLKKNPYIYSFLQGEKQLNPLIFEFVLKNNPKQLEYFPNSLRVPCKENIHWIEKYGCRMNHFHVPTRNAALFLAEKFPIQFFVNFPRYRNDKRILKMMERRKIWIPTGMLNSRVGGMKEIKIIKIKK